MKQKELIWRGKEKVCGAHRYATKRRTDFVLQHFGREAGSDRRDRCGTVLLRKDFRLSKII